MAAPLPFRYEIEMSDQESTIKCHGKVVSETAGELKNLVKPLIHKCRRIVLDFTDVVHLDSSGLGTLVGLKISATAAADCRLEFINLSPRVQELLHITKLTQLFKSFTTESHTPPAADKESRPEPLSEAAEEAAVEDGEPEAASTEWHTPAATEEEEPESLSVEEGIKKEECEPVAIVTRESAADESHKRAASQKTAKKIVPKTVEKAAKKQAKKSAKKKTGKKEARSRRS
jgi:anti-anti-sigma factor